MARDDTSESCDTGPDDGGHSWKANAFPARGGYMIDKGIDDSGTMSFAVTVDENPKWLNIIAKHVLTLEEAKRVAQQHWSGRLS